ncbi:MAG TPA: hypothetical protein VGG76_08750 [Gemmatimonadaceae bacterium]
MIARRGLIALLAAGAAACSTDTAPPDNGPVSTVLLKDVEIATLPSPFYHFEYDVHGRVINVSYASGFYVYDYHYAANRLSEVRSSILANNDRLVYSYDNAGRAAEVGYVDSMGVEYARVSLTYSGSKLVTLERSRLLGGVFVLEKTMAMTYDAEGNLVELTEHLPAIDGHQTEATFVDRYAQYDTGINVDGFALIHDEFFDHLVLLPGVQLQKGNPGTQVRTGDGLNFSITYSYTYDSRNRPLSKTGQFTYDNGPDIGRVIQTSSLFSYY